VELAYRYGERTPLHVKAIGLHHGISDSFLLHILLQLKKSGLVESIRGYAGGYLLNRNPSKISLADVVNAVDQSPAQPPTAQAALNSTSAVQAVNRCLQEVQAVVQQRLGEITIADLVTQSQPVSELLFQI
jgi:Rrf2 family protein